jgi:hypothetical protein
MNELTAEWVAKAEGDFALVRLDRYAVRFRYPGEFAEKAEARAALDAAEVVRVSIRDKLGLPSE